jgi:hypothetical protein
MIVTISDILVDDLEDTGSFLDPQDPAVFISVAGQPAQGTER